MKPPKSWNLWGTSRGESRNSAITALVADVKQNGFKADAMGQSMDIALTRPEAVADLVRAIVAELPKGGTYLHAALSYLPETDYPAVVAHALKAIAANRDNAAARSVIEYASLQCPASVDPHRAVIARLNAGSRLVRDDRADIRDGAQQPRSTESPVFHLVFENGYLSQPERWIAAHPTWHLTTPADSPAMPFGGLLAAHHAGGGLTTCAACGGTLHHLLTLCPVPDGLGVSSMDRIVFACCLSCLGWEVEKLFYTHDPAGQPASTGYTGPHLTPQFPARPLAPTTVRRSPTPPRWRRQDWGLSNSRENLFRVGGTPTWIQDEDHATCPRCDRTMTALLQLDSSLPLTSRTDGDGPEEEWLWGSGGIAYVQWCDACNVSAVFWQNT
jgi:hypothetical protein